MKIVNFNDDDLQFETIDAGGGSIYSYHGQPLTGIIEEYYDNGNLAGEMEYKNGYCDGIVRL